jgi:hypothetical protein
MRRLLIAIAALGAAVSFTGPASAAPLRVLHAHRVTADGIWTGVADATTVAYRTGSGAPVVLRSDDGSSRTVAAPEGCAISAAGGGLLTSECGRPTEVPHGINQVQLHLAVSRLDGSPVTRFDAVGWADLANAQMSNPPYAIGSQWIRIPNSAKQVSSWSEDVNWHTGDVRETRDTETPAVVDLANPALSVPLCAPLKRVHGVPDIDGLPGYYGAEVRGSWALVDSAAGFTLRHCGLARAVQLPQGFAPDALGDGWVAGHTTIAHRSPRVDVIRLSDRRRFAVAGVPGALTHPGVRLAFTRGRLYVFGGEIDTIMLPRR